MVMIYKSQRHKKKPMKEEQKGGQKHRGDHYFWLNYGCQILVVGAAMFFPWFLQIIHKNG